MRGEDLKCMTEEEYTKLMIFFTNLIYAIALDPQQGQKIRIQVIATACVYFRRFYARRSLKDIDPFLLAPTTIFLASKVEEHGMMSHNKLIQATNSALKRWPFIPQDLVIRVQNIQEAEFILLEIMDCCLMVYHPYRVIFRPLNQLMADMSREYKDLDAISTYAWKICNDYTRTDLSLLYPPHLIAIGDACILIASIWTNRDKELKNWFAELAVDFDKIFEIQKVILNMYSIWKTFDEKEQLLPILQKMPRPNPGPQNTNSLVQQHSHNSLTMNSMGVHQSVSMGPPQMPSGKMISVGLSSINKVNEFELKLWKGNVF
ncbi:unnamed protein product [Dracunculus medinensis]|uniref:Cyclin-C n=1 Tax=Dracunculus medinensis TaxID=318479 RepID=A0A0N4UBE2_DRAME|nr:unnamed protein product [Dracunculus medinensis]